MEPVVKTKFKHHEIAMLNNAVPEEAGNLRGSLVKIVGINLDFGYIVEFVDPEQFVDASSVVESFDKLRVFMVQQEHLDKVHVA